MNMPEQRPTLQPEVSPNKWPNVAIVRHGEAGHNQQLHKQKKHDPLFQRFVCAYEERPNSPRTLWLAWRVDRKYRRTAETHEYTASLTDEGRQQMRQAGEGLRELMQGKLPDAIFIGLAPRFQQSLDAMADGWPELKALLDTEQQLPEKDRIVKKDSRVDEQDFGVVSTYTDPRVYYTFHPRQRRYRELASPYRYRFPQGESINDVRDRVRAILSKIIRDHKALGQENVLIISSTYWQLSAIANIEGWDDERFLRFYNDPINTSLRNGSTTLFEARPANARHPEGYLHQALYNATPDDVKAFAAKQRHS